MPSESSRMKRRRGASDRGEPSLDRGSVAGERYAGSERHVRIILFEHYRITYLVKSERVEVLGVFHGALDISCYSL